MVSDLPTAAPAPTVGVNPPRGSEADAIAATPKRRIWVLAFVFITLMGLGRVATNTGGGTGSGPELIPPPPHSPSTALLPSTPVQSAPSSSSRVATSTAVAVVHTTTGAADSPSSGTAVVGVATLSAGYNPSGACGGRQPNTTAIEEYPGCPIPGLNNLLYTQHNRWYCIYRDRSVVTLRDRTCNKGSHEKYRYSTVLQVRYDRMAAFHAWVEARRAAGLPRPEFGNSRRGGRGGLVTGPEPPTAPAAVREAYSRFAALLDAEAPHARPLTTAASGGGPTLCWADIKEKKSDLPARCEWSDIPRFHGTSEWWEARTFIDFHPEYYTAVRRVLEAHLGAGPPPFIGVHLRRGDFQHHCTVLKRKRLPPTVQFWSVPTLVSADGLGPGSCYPTLAEIRAGFDTMVRSSGVRLLGLATNDPAEMVPLLTPLRDVPACLATSAAWCAFVLPAVTDRAKHPLVRGRRLDTLIMDIVMLASASHFIFNRWSSFSGTAFEVATIHGRTNASNVRCW